MKSRIFRCINCGGKAEELYRDYRNGIIKLEHCGNVGICDGSPMPLLSLVEDCNMARCDEVVDKYIEFDPVFICLDALLLKRHAFRHVFNNSGRQQAHWKLTIILLLCDAYTRLVQQRPEGHRARSMPDYVIYSALEWELYWNFFIASVELAVGVLVIVGVMYILNGITNNTGENMTSTTENIRGLLLSNFGKVLVVPAVLWENDYSHINLMLSHLFVFVSNIQALRDIQAFRVMILLSNVRLLGVMCPGWNKLYYICTVGIGYLVSLATTSFLQQTFTTNR